MPNHKHHQFTFELQNKIRKIMTTVILEEYLRYVC